MRNLLLNKIKNKLIYFLLLINVIIQSSCNKEEESRSETKEIFLDQTKHLGINFKHKNGMNGHLYYIEMMGAAAVLFDYDNDDDLDIYLGQGGDIELIFERQIVGKLFRNDLDKGELKFTDVTEQSGLISNGYSMGAATADINNDGFVDIYLTHFGKNEMFLNNTDGTFTNISASSNLDIADWSTSASFLDYNKDGLLDLYVTNYLQYSIKNNKVCQNETGSNEYCGPNSYNPAQDRIFKNLGNNQFEDVTSALGINQKGAGLGVVSADYNNDGYQDIYVTNDMSHNFLWINNKGVFENESLMRGNAVNHHGKPEASMGVDAGDIDNDGDFDLFMTHLLNETNTVYMNNGKGFFSDKSSAIGLGNPSKGYTGFGTAFLDYDNDGWLDIITINGEVRQIQEQIDNGIELPLEQGNQLFKNTKGFFSEVTDQASILSTPKVSRGLAIGDIDNDGDTDVLISNNNDYVQLLINQIGNEQNWIGFSLIDKSGKPLIGSLIKVKSANTNERLRRSRTDASYISANDPRVIVGLGSDSSAVDVEVVWSKGQVSKWVNLDPNRYQELIKYD